MDKGFTMTVEEKIYEASLVVDKITFDGYRMFQLNGIDGSYTPMVAVQHVANVLETMKLMEMDRNNNFHNIKQENEDD